MHKFNIDTGKEINKNAHKCKGWVYMILYERAGGMGLGLAFFSDPKKTWDLEIREVHFYEGRIFSSGPPGT